MTVRISNPWGLAVLAAVVFGPGVLVSSVTGEMRWLILLPVGTVAIMLAFAALPIGRKVTPLEYAEELERHLLGDDDDAQWDQTSCVRLSDPKLERLRRSLPDAFDALEDPTDRNELKSIVEALRHGEYPEEQPPRE
jgi:hypothetical protein